MPFVPAPATPPRTAALLKTMLHALFTGNVVKTTSERLALFPLEFETVTSPVPTTPPLSVTTEPKLFPVAIVRSLVKVTVPLSVKAKSVAITTFFPDPATVTGFASVILLPPETGELAYRAAATSAASALPVPSKT